MLSPIFHTTQSPTRGKASTRAFHTMDPFEDLIDFPNHSMTKRLGIYLDLITLVHSVFPADSRHRFLPTNALSKRHRSFIPQLPKSLGVAKEDHFAKWSPLIDLFPTHKKRLLSYLYYYCYIYLFIYLLLLLLLLLLLYILNFFYFLLLF